jgi:hypothetical protein
MCIKPPLYIPHIRINPLVGEHPGALRGVRTQGQRPPGAVPGRARGIRQGHRGDAGGRGEREGEVLP